MGFFQVPIESIKIALGMVEALNDLNRHGIA